MEIAPAPPRRRLSPRARVLLAVGIFGPVTLLALLPTMFGLQRYVVASDSMSGGIERGSVVFERRVPVGDLRVGDVITYERPEAADSGGLVTHRIEWIDGARLQTRGDAEKGPDPWLVALDEPTMSRVVMAVPYVGYPFIAPIGPSVWLLVLLVPGALLAFLLVQDARRARRAPAQMPHRVGTSPR
ncbi:signal peptidase I [Nocardioides sp.]|uniref:signal peptidase I n=1 Tax=Nocardioides sp. TaxID=35761 RepID=UPI00286CCBFB|nr:signal peptidase I [Nocardioides sp.]